MTLRAVRETRGFTLREVEIVTAIPYSTLAKVERGESFLTGEQKIRLVRALGLTSADAREIAELAVEVPA
jgi:transcriptional regulator with XRE-family HTH domain